MTIAKFNFNKLQQVFLDWISVHKQALMVLALLFLTLKLVASAPYLNLVLDDYFVFATTIFLAIFFINIKLSKLIIIIIILFIISFIFWSLGRFEEAETVTNYIYPILLSGVLKKIINL